MAICISSGILKGDKKKNVDDADFEPVPACLDSWIPPKVISRVMDTEMSMNAWGPIKIDLSPKRQTVKS